MFSGGDFILNKKINKIALFSKYEESGKKKLARVRKENGKTSTWLIESCEKTERPWDWKGPESLINKEQRHERSIALAKKCRNLYYKYGSYTKVARMVGVASSTVQNAVNGGDKRSKDHKDYSLPEYDDPRGKKSGRICRTDGCGKDTRDNLWYCNSCHKRMIFLKKDYLSEDDLECVCHFADDLL